MQPELEARSLVVTGNLRSNQTSFGTFARIPAFEDAGVLFIDENGGGSGVRLPKRQQTKG